MITFGGRPLNTYNRIYKGGELQSANPSTNEFVKSSMKSATESIAQSIKPIVVDVNSKLVTINGPGLVNPATNQAIKPNIVDVNSKLVTINGPGLFNPATNEDMRQPVVVEVKPESVKIDGPGLFDLPKNKDNHANQDPQMLNPNDPFNPDNVDKMNKAIEDRKFKNRLLVKIFGKEIVLTFEFIIWLCGILWTLIIATIIFSICYFLYEITQGVLNAYHTVVDGITKLMEEINNVAIKFEVPGINKKIGPFNISMPPLLKVDFKLFGGMFNGPLRDMYRASSFTRSATELIIQILIQMVTSIIETLPAILDGIVSAFEKIADAI
jgi:hypothetical protein